MPRLTDKNAVRIALLIALDSEKAMVDAYRNDLNGSNDLDGSYSQDPVTTLAFDGEAKSFSKLGHLLENIRVFRCDEIMSAQHTTRFDQTVTNDQVIMQHRIAMVAIEVNNIETTQRETGHDGRVATVSNDVVTACRIPVKLLQSQTKRLRW